MLHFSPSLKQTTPMPAALLPTSRKEREKWGTTIVSPVNTKTTVRLRLERRGSGPSAGSQLTRCRNTSRIERFEKQILTA